MQLIVACSDQTLAGSLDQRNRNRWPAVFDQGQFMQRRGDACLPARRSRRNV